MPLVMVTLYLLACVVTGIMGRKTVFGFMGHFFLSIIITPVIDFVIQAIGRPNREIRKKMEEIGR